MTAFPSPSDTGGPFPSGPAQVGAWAPLAHAAYRTIWLAVLFSNIGTWMQTVGAQLLLVDERRASTLVALVQTASTLPVVLLALPGGVLADTFDRRRLLLAVQVYMATVGVVLAALTAAGQMRPPLLLLLTFALGVGTALTAPTYQALIPELVPRAELPAASSLGAVSMNVARAVGPAAAGLIISRIGTAAVFAINAATFVVFAGVLLLWRREPLDATGERERFGPALRAGGRYVRHSPVVRRLLMRVTLFLLPAMALWALLPLIAIDRLGIGASGYGLLLAALGVGAVAGVFVLPRVRGAMSPNQQLIAASTVFALSTAVAGTVVIPGVVVVALLPAGAAWVAVLSLLNSTLQLHLPAWVRARGLAIYQIASFGAQALAALAWGLVAESFGLVQTFIISATLMAVSGATALLWPIRDVPTHSQGQAAYWEQPQLVLDPEPITGPIMVQVTYQVDEPDEINFLAAMERVRRSRQRTGAYWWQIYRDGENPGHFVEAFLVSSWEEHLRQHNGRLTQTDATIEREARAYSRSTPVVHHLFPA
jgi:MFS family permease